jgi:DNA-damage-inducible protein J
MSQTNVTVRMDADLKKQAEVLFEAFGMNMTTALTIFVKTAVREQRIPFEIAINSPNKRILKTIEDIDNDINMSKTFSDIDDLMEDLDA